VAGTATLEWRNGPFKLRDYDDNDDCAIQYVICFMFCMFYMCSSAKVIYCYLREAVSVVLHLDVLLRIL